MQEEFDFIRKLRSGCRKIDLPELDDAALDLLFIYYRELKHWSRKINLIAKKATNPEILEKHFLDSLTLLPLLGETGSHLLDIGTGAGFPGLVCKVAKPDLQLTLVEPRQKRVAFLSHVTRTLKLEDVAILTCRAGDEKMLPSAGGYTHITSRAVSDIKVFLDMSSRFLRPGIQVICMKGPKWEAELAAWEQSQDPNQLHFISRKEYRLPQFEGARHLLVFEQKISIYSD
ncbi:MAG: 16S rRNA (guanine(527)-N(7))-methyltransferase RsmG [Thermodesulfobacteriota bacterium]|nr:16S rRNA (guanine(527)-N(7))-methyltransferase RsmG [Thermodesulfobacteriota bacterium]